MLIVMTSLFAVGCPSRESAELDKAKLSEMDRTERQKLVGRTIKGVDRLNDDDLVIWFEDGSRATVTRDSAKAKIEFAEGSQDKKK